MNIIILCDQTDCMYNKSLELPTGTEWKMKGDDICTFNHPVFYKYGDNRYCASKCIKHVKSNPCTNCEMDHPSECALCCHKNYYKDANNQDQNK